MPETRLGYVDTRVGQLHFVKSGAGDPIVMLPGAGQSHNSMHCLMAELALNYEVYAINRPGSGYSSPLPAAVDFPAWADAVTDAIEGLALSRPVLYGMNTGNKITASVAGRYPELVSSIVLCGQSHTIIPDMTRRTAVMRHSAGSRAQSSDGEAAQLRARLGLWRELELFWWGGKDGLGLLSEEEFLTRRLVAGDRLLADASMRQLYEANFLYDLEADLRRVNCPTLIVEIATPREDAQVGRQGEALLEIIQDARLVTFEEPDGMGITLEDRAGELASAITAFIEAASTAARSS